MSGTKKKKSSAYKKTLASILEQLENKGIKTAALLDLAEQYMTLWESAQELKADLEERLDTLRTKYYESESRD